MAKEDGVRHPPGNICLEAVPQNFKPSHLALPDRLSRSRAKPDNTRHILCASPQALFLTATLHQSSTRQMKTDIGKSQSAHALRPANLMGRDKQSIGTQPLERDAPRRLHSVTDHKPARLVDKGGSLRNWLEDTRLIIGSLQGQQHPPAIGLRRQSLQRDQIELPVRLKRNNLDVIWLETVPLQDASMFASRHQQAGQRFSAIAQGGRENEIGRLGAARGKGNVPRTHAQKGRYLTAGLLNGRPCCATFRVDGGGIARQIECTDHGRARCGKQRGRRIMVEIDPL